MTKPMINSKNSERQRQGNLFEELTGRSPDNQSHDQKEQTVKIIVSTGRGEKGWKDAHGFQSELMESKINWLEAIYWEKAGVRGNFPFQFRPALAISWVPGQVIRKEDCPRKFRSPAYWLRSLAPRKERHPRAVRRVWARPRKCLIPLPVRPPPCRSCRSSSLSLHGVGQ